MFVCGLIFVGLVMGFTFVLDCWFFIGLVCFGCSVDCYLCIFCCACLCVNCESWYNSRFE